MSVQTKAVSSVTPQLEKTDFSQDPVLEIDNVTKDADTTNTVELSYRKTSITPQPTDDTARTYHADGTYPLPIDAPEQERLNLQHRLFYETFYRKLYLAPIEVTPKSVLDIGTGTGIWAIDFAKLHPSVGVHGTDISPMWPSSFPQNCHFSVSNLEEPWSHPHKFDYIHGRALGSCFKDPSSVVAKAFAALSPGGYLELQDCVMPMKYLSNIPTDSALYEWNTNILAAAELAGRPWTNVKNYPQYFQAAGFEDIVVRTFYWPTNDWPKGEYLKRVGLLFREDLMEGLEGLSMKLMMVVLGWDRERVAQLLEGVRRDLGDTKICGYAQISVVYGRKP